MRERLSSVRALSILRKKLTFPERLHLQTVLFRIKRHAFSVSFRIHNEPRTNSCRICTCTKSRSKSLRICTYKTSNLNPFRMSTCEETRRTVRSQVAAESSKLADSKSANLFRIKLLSQNAKQLPWNHTLAKKPGGRGYGLERNLKFAMRETHRQPLNRLC